MRTPSFLLAIVTASFACGGAPEHVRVAAPAPVASTLPPPAAALPVDRPASVALWVHVAKPVQLAAIAEQLSTTNKSKPEGCAGGDVADCLALIDSTRPVDAAVAVLDGEGEEATAFSVTSVDAFLDGAKRSFPKSEARAGVAKLGPKTFCDVGNARRSLRVVCGTERGIAEMGPWLRSAPRLETKGLARGKIFSAPLRAASDQSFAGAGARDEALRLLAHDFAGGSFELSTSDAKDAPLALDVDLDVRDPKSPWTRALLAPTASAAAVPDAFGRLSRDATATAFAPGGGALLALVDQLAPFGSWTSTDPAKTQRAIAGLREALQHPIACAHAIDFDEARTALDRARHASPKDQDKADAALDAAFDSHWTCGVQEPIAAVRDLARAVVAGTPQKRGDSMAIRPGAALGLPKDAFVVETTTTPAKNPGDKKPAAPKKSDLLVLPDGDTTWVVSGADPRLTARFAQRLLAAPRGPLPEAQAPAGAILSGSIASLFGAFALDLALRQRDDLAASLAIAAPGRLRFVLAQRRAEDGGAISLHLASDVATLKKLSSGAGPLVLVVGAMAIAFAGEPPSK